MVGLCPHFFAIPCAALASVAASVPSVITGWAIAPGGRGARSFDVSLPLCKVQSMSKCFVWPQKCRKEPWKSRLRWDDDTMTRNGSEWQKECYWLVFTRVDWTDGINHEDVGKLWKAYANSAHLFAYRRAYLSICFLHTTLSYLHLHLVAIYKYMYNIILWYVYIQYIYISQLWAVWAKWLEAKLLAAALSARHPKSNASTPCDVATPKLVERRSILET